MEDLRELIKAYNNILNLIRFFFFFEIHSFCILRYNTLLWIRSCFSRMSNPLFYYLNEVLKTNLVSFWIFFRFI